MTQRFGIDTSILVRLVTGLPSQDFEETVDALSKMVEQQGIQLVACSMVIGEAYMAIQHHYGVSKSDTRAGLIKALTSGLVKPMHGQATLDVISQAAKGCGLMDRLIAHEYEHASASVLTLDRKMANLPGAARLA